MWWFGLCFLELFLELQIFHMPPCHLQYWGPLVACDLWGPLQIIFTQSVGFFKVYSYFHYIFEMWMSHTHPGCPFSFWDSGRFPGAFSSTRSFRHFHHPPCLEFVTDNPGALQEENGMGRKVPGQKAQPGLPCLPQMCVFLLQTCKKHNDVRFVKT